MDSEVCESKLGGTYTGPAIALSERSWVVVVEAAWKKPCLGDDLLLNYCLSEF